MWRKVTNVVFCPEKRGGEGGQSSEERPGQTALRKLGPQRKVNVVDFERQSRRVPFLHVSPYDNDDSIEVEKKHLDRYFLENKRPNSQVKRCTRD